MAGQDDAGPLSKVTDQLARTALQHKSSYKFWETQPVTQFSEDSRNVESGAVETKTLADVRQEPSKLPDLFEWCTYDITDPTQLHEVHDLLEAHYVEDDEHMFRFAYSADFLRWALAPPGYKQDWHLGVRVKANKKLVACITAVPADVVVNGKKVPMVEINFLCVHQKLRSKRLAPVLIKEITRRVNLHGVWQAAYTAGVVLPKPVTSARYWHRSLQPKKLLDVGFSRLGPRQTLARTIRKYSVSERPDIPGIRSMVAADVPQVTKLLVDYLARYELYQHFTEAEVAHWLLPRETVVHAYVVVEGEDEGGDPGAGGGTVVDFLSFYSLPSSVLQHPVHSDLVAAYMYYTVPGKHTLPELLRDAFVLAKSSGHDVFNALDILENAEVLEELKFQIGDGFLQYYLYNWRMRQVAPRQTGLILL